ncbi:Hypothetical predicted protein [Olea europaea subsp. europaea]|uniref:Uncharacterized protein n=1 Tax=Olea europaea subsp. europaea TaxID=158383 RepID=A0A8S0SCL5_OLEEU|nr:Hypothetical predicted protein [Olea europaea subsp. europaea]
MISAVYNASSLLNQLSAIEILTGNNYVRWKRDVEIALGLLGLDFAMEKKLEKPTYKSTVKYVAEHEKWERTNKLYLNSLPSKFNQLKVAYNAQRDKWNLNDLIAVCAQEEYRMRRETVETVQLAFQPSQNKEPSHNHKSKFRKGNKSH